MIMLTSLLLALVFVAAEPTTEPVTGEITGIVVDENGKPASDVPVLAQESGQKMRFGFEAVTDDKGRFTIRDVPEGQYNLKFRTRDGRFKAARTANVLAGRTRDVGKVQLKPA